ncbi:hypothetical protein E0493_20615 [Roseomonas sp. M0104]|uniref:Uncharacterized protein n=1 Tax=Teichococcus coralli TaxID=2545983 RepID=A0A845BKF7_9PROT|nr:hypothetical protein [Pseudoroseomonas coralli]MXP65757.1 hypothetical protein [Pseudoroseomonas coralli]
MRRFAFSPLPLLLVAALGGCAEMRTPPSAFAVPLDLMPGATDPLRSAVDMAVADFADQGAALAGRPVRTARAAARLEYLAEVLAADPRYAALPPGTILALRGAVGEVRRALGLSEITPPEQAVTLLAGAARALEAGRRPPLPEAVFPAGPEVTLRRLNEPGPLPEAAIATGRLQETVAALDATAGWSALGETTDPGKVLTH